MGNPDTLIHTLGARSVAYEFRDQDDAGEDPARIEALRRAVGDLARRVGKLEQALDILKADAAPGKSPQRQVSPVIPKAHRPASGRAPTGETLHRRARIRIRP
jgi:hypothetical protein